MEWIIVDDGVDSVEDLFKPLLDKYAVHYMRVDNKMTIGAKRNLMQDMAHGEYLVWFDDDDYYPPERISHAINMLRSKGTKAPLLAGSSALYLYVSSLKKIYYAKPLHPWHATNGTMVVHKDYAKKHRYDDTEIFGEEKKYLNDHTEPLLQLNPAKTMLVMSHNDNTVDKTKLLNHDVFTETSLTLKHFIRNKEMREFYASL
jgi:glycosyltransferase involved in cell wall biosynthesis